MSDTPLAPTASAASRGQPVAGRELDAEVAEKVMGLAPITLPCVLAGVPLTAVWTDEAYAAYRESYPRGAARKTVPHYSTDIAAAMDALSEVGGIVTIRRMKPDEWHVRLHDEKEGWWAETLPLAICIALLAAVSVPGVSR